MSKLVKSENDQLDIDEELINEVSNADEFKDKDLTAEDVVEALQAIDALADAVLEKADAEDKELDADQLLDEVRDMIDTTHEEEEVELEEEEILPEELTNAAVRVMVSDEGDIEVEKVPDEIYDDEIDGLECTVYDTCDMPSFDIEDTADEAGDDLLVIGNSKSKSFKKGFVKISSSVSKKAWSAAYKKVRKMVKSGKLTAAHWVIVSAIAQKLEERNKLMKKIECSIVKKIRSSADYKKRLLKSDMQEAVDDASVDEKKVEPEEVAGKDNPGYEQENMEKSPETVDSQSGNPTVDPEKQNEREGDIPVLDDEMITLDVPLANSRRKIALKKVVANHRKGFSAYRVLGASNTIKNALDGKVVKSGKGAFIFKDTANGLLACAAKFIGDGKGTYSTFIKNGKVVIAKAGEAVKLFNNVEKLMNAKAVHSVRRPVMSMTFRDAVRDFKSSGSWDDYWAMQQDWEVYVDELARDGSISERQRDTWGNPCTPETFKRWNKIKSNLEVHSVRCPVMSRRSLRSSLADTIESIATKMDGVVEVDNRYDEVDVYLKRGIDESKADILADKILGEMESKGISGWDAHPAYMDYTSDEERKYDYVIVIEKSDGIESSHRAVRSSRQRIEASKKSADMKKVISARREAALAKIEAKREVRKAQMLASRNEARLMEMHDAEERQRLFQSSQSAINEEKIAIKQGMSRNSSTLDKLYGNMF